MTDRPRLAGPLTAEQANDGDNPSNFRAMADFANELRQLANQH